jgi:tRNA-uridine 2-sulfurtransferase
MSRVVLAMSGGVDSSVAAWLLREAGHEVIGLFMRHGQNVARPGESTLAGTAGANPHKQGCCTAADAADARRMADRLRIPFYVLNFEQDFKRIIDYFVAEYSRGRTPNPCIVCNTWLKFGRLFDYADSVGAEFVATGHYATLRPGWSAEGVSVRQVGGKGGERVAGEVALCRGVDASKDQSYALFGIPRERLTRLLFPVGEHRKTDIRRIARLLGLRVAAKRDSQEICFVPDGDHARFVRNHRAAAGEKAAGSDTSGEIVTTDGTVVGRHDGIERFTVGQRKGLGVALGRRTYVVRIEADTRRVVLGDPEDLARAELTASGANWLVDPPSEPMRCEVKVRYRSPSLPATVEPLDAARFRVRFDEPCGSVAPGQAAVCYRGDRVLGGGWIE